MKFGIFMAPFHRVGENPTLAFERDMQLIEWLDELGYEEAFIGEHHSAGWEIIPSPEIFMAVAATRTKRIMLGSGVVSVPYHHPFNVANRFALLDCTGPSPSLFRLSGFSHTLPSQITSPSSPWLSHCSRLVTSPLPQEALDEERRPLRTVQQSAEPFGASPKASRVQVTASFG